MICYHMACAAGQMEVMVNKIDPDSSASMKKHDSYHHGDLRRDLLRVAREEIARHGAEGVTLAALARRAGVTQPAPYRHFADRQALLQAVAAEAFADLAQCLSDATAGEMSPGETAAALVLAYLNFGEANIELYRLMFASRLTPEAEEGSALACASQNAFELLRRHLGREADRDGKRRRDRAIYSRWAQLHGLVMLKADGFITSPLASYVSLLKFSSDAE